MRRADLERKREAFRFLVDFSVVRNDDPAGRPPLRLFSLLLTSIPDRDYPYFAMGGFDSELFRKESRGARKSKSLSPKSKYLSLVHLTIRKDYIIFRI
jgi:hypothetical protein